MGWNVFLTSKVMDQESVDAETEETAPAAEESETVVTIHQVDGFTSDLTEAAESCRNSTVMVRADSTSGERNAGGVIYDRNGDDIYVFTVIDVLDATENIRVRFDSGREISAEIAGLDPQSGVGLLKVTVPFNTTSIEKGDSALIQTGEYVLAMGMRRMDSETRLVSFGIISTPGQKRVDSTSTWLCSVIETDAVVNNYNVGGPLLNISGEMIGLLINRPSEGHTDMGYALAVNELEEIYSQIRDKGSVTRGSLGAVVRSVSSLESYQKSEKGISMDIIDGVLVTSIVSGSAAAESLMENDILLMADGESIADEADLRARLYGKNPGDTVNFTVIRSGEEVTIPVVLK